MTWRNTDDDLPDWRDAGRAEFLFPDGRVAKGTILIDEHWSGSEEFPLALVKLDDGSEPSLFDLQGWRRLT